MSLNTNIQTDAKGQRLYLAVIDDSGAEQIAYGKVELKLGDITAIIDAAPAVLPVDVDSPAEDVKFRELQVCLDDGTQGYAIFLVGGIYKKS